MEKNWKTIITDILMRGHSLASIGREIGTTGEAVRAMTINEGQSPRWTNGNKLLLLHKRVMRKYPKIDELA